MQKPNEHEVYRIRMFIRGRDGTGRRDYSNNQNPTPMLAQNMGPEYVPHHRRVYRVLEASLRCYLELSHTSTSPHHLAACWVHSDQTLKFQFIYRSWFNFDLGPRIFFFPAGFVDVYLRHGLTTGDTTEETMFEAKCTTRLSVNREPTTLTRGESWPVAACHITRLRRGVTKNCGRVSTSSPQKTQHIIFNV